MTAIILANMGAPTSEKDMRFFLKRMFNDKAILYAPKLVRAFVSSLISTLRYKSSWKKYELIGGSPLLKSMATYSHDLQAKLNKDYVVRSVYSYSQPFIKEEIITLHKQGIKDFFIISMYPQASFSTTGSVQADIQQIKSQYPDVHIEFKEEYFDNQYFIDFWVNQIRTKISSTGYKAPFLLFSSHAIPQSFVKRGDPYVEQLKVSAQLIAKQLNLPFGVSFQSKIGPIAWTKPYTKEFLNELKTKGIDEIIVIPLSFINENLETKYDQDYEIVPFARQELGIKNICRVELPLSDKIIVDMFIKFIEDGKY
jgi:ferrochelatase